MADLMGGTSTWATGTADTASLIENGEDEKRAEHITGMASFIVALQGILGPAADLKGDLADLATRLAVGISASGVLTSAEPGDFMLSARSSKTGWLLCDGSAVSRSTYADLFAEIGTKYGPGDSSTTFNLPNFAGRSPVGAGTGIGGGTSGLQGSTPAGGATLSVRAVGDWFGAETHSLTAAQNGQHQHTLTTVGDEIGSGGSVSSIYDVSPGASVTTEMSGSGSPHNTIHPCLTVNVFIKT